MVRNQKIFSNAALQHRRINDINHDFNAQKHFLCGRNAHFYRIKQLKHILHVVQKVFDTILSLSESSTGTVRRIFHQKSCDSTAPVRCPAGGRKNRTIFIIYLDIVRCPVNLSYYLKFHGAHTAFCRVIEGKITSAGSRTGIVRCPDGHRPIC